ncbi:MULTISPECIES: DUF2793 domain-containing protein [unclassified Mesorhizobium]|uniref:DUF2793 domain-containing protein n=1 Tax=unclassified Mesorhizobium TaxID=325217 RepID=UPI000FD6E56E|nr:MULTISPECIES: DUF2793 domain-containing protein [unclassified Mesorhizobium]TGT76703.1 DUF2793 domain-containing protein [Mesorhizobium sp. M2E.F.Ca.ET.166.01.1.1]TGW02815.1 DUF2793 domain-containing protein [Mesorhizobium sp. M2E.F.Ca.ET.154.01.1.1]
MTVSNRLGITELAATQVDRSATVNEAIAKLEGGSALYGCVSVGDTAPPGSPAEGDQYVLGASPTGAWSGKAKYIANFYNGAWIFIPPLPGAQAYAADEDAYYYYDGSAWALTSTSGGLGDVNGPGSSVSGNLATFSGTTGKVIQDSGVAISTDATLGSNSNSKAPTEQAVKGYVDGRVTGLSWKKAVRAATTGALPANTYSNGTSGVGATLTGNSNGALSAQDGVTLVANDDLLVKDEATGANRGIYTLTQVGDGSHPYILTRRTDADAGAELVNASVYVSEGTTLADTQWTCTTNATITVGTTSLAFTQAGIGGFIPASTTEVLTGTDTSKGVTPDALAALWEKGSDVASAGTVSLGEGGFFHITGTTTITDIDWATAKDGRPAWVIFDGALTLTHNSTTLKLPGGANITTAAGDRACFIQDSGDNVICVAYIKADGTAVVSSGGTTKPFLTFLPDDQEYAGSNYAAIGVRNGHPTLEFDTTTQQTAIFTGVLPASYAGGGLTADCTWAAASATSGTIGWDVAIERIDAGTLDIDADSFASAQTITAATVPGTSGVTSKTSCSFTSGAQMDSLAAGEPFRVRLRRDVANDTAAGNAQMISLVIRET